MLDFYQDDKLALERKSTKKKRGHTLLPTSILETDDKISYYIDWENYSKENISKILILTLHQNAHPLVQQKKV